jgi:ABC-type transport system involved in multi-copper enzyme maturation permease subunit
MNPVLARELRQRMRGRWAPVVLTLYLLLLSAVLYLVHSAYVRAESSGLSAVQAGAVGRTLFQTLLFFMLLLLCFLVPGLSSGAVAGERERQTLVPLQVTLLKPRSIVVGKLLASLAFVVLLLVATLPLISVSLIIGGVGLPEVVRAMGMLLGTAVLLASLAVASSALVRRVQGATVVAYGLTFVLLLGTLLAFAAQLVVTQDPVDQQSQAVLLVNPVFAVADVIGGRHQSLSGGGSPFTPAQELLRRRDKGHEIFDDVSAGGDAGGGFVVNDGNGIVARRAPVQGPVRHVRGRRVPFWLASLLTWAVIIAGSLTLAARRLRAPAPSVGA